MSSVLVNDKSITESRILIVDDDPPILNMISHYIKDNGYIVETADSGQDALNKLESSQAFDLVVLDVMMPDITGLDVLKTVRKSKSFFELPILILSALTDTKDIVTGLNCGANDYMTKPTKKIELLARIHNLISLKQVYDTALTNEQLASHRSHYDELTGLPNRSLLNKNMRDLITLANISDTSIALYFINIDGFKTINDSLGYAIGDIFLKESGWRLKKTLSPNDFLARIHSDVFALLERNIDPNDSNIIEEHANNIRELMGEDIVINQYSLKLSASVGISVYPNDSQTVDDLFRHADAALNVAKHQGGNKIKFCDPTILSKAATRLNIKSMLRKALDNEEFIIYYQPQLDIGTNTVIGAEALIRWNHPEGGLISPAKFIPVAEETGIIVPMSEWIIENVAKQTKLWESKGLPEVKIGINLSPIQFQASNLTSYIKGVVDRVGLDPKLLDLEITESAIMSNLDQAIKTLNELRDLGFYLSLDDFGTGYSSLNYLKRFPVHTLKIDQSFVSDLGFDSQNSAIVSTIIKLAHNLNLRVIAEGVETPEQLKYLTQNYCNEIQGFILSKPIPLEDFELLLNNKTVATGFIFDLQKGHIYD